MIVDIFQHMLTRFPTLPPDSPWEAKAITLVRSIQDNKVIYFMYRVIVYWIFIRSRLKGV